MHQQHHLHRHHRTHLDHYLLRLLRHLLGHHFYLYFHDHDQHEHHHQHQQQYIDITTTIIIIIIIINYREGGGSSGFCCPASLWVFGVGLLLSSVRCLVLPCCLPGFPSSLSVVLGPRLLSFSVLSASAWRKLFREGCPRHKTSKSP